LTDFVLDNSICMRWCFNDAANDYPENVLKQLEAGAQAHVPVLWLYEVASVLAKGQKDGTIAPSEAADFIADLQALNITVDPDSAHYVLTETHRLAVAHRLTGYDAAYLELARRKQLPLATLDEELIKTCKAIGHPLF
jgi:predicted nucleic acid-binding protein